MGYENELEFAKQLAREAGEIMREYFLSDNLDIKQKDDKTPVTVADTKINRLVIDKVKERFPECGVIGEEDSYETERENVWVVDPIDGTIPFTLGIPVSTFSLAFVEEGIVKVAVVFDPNQDRLFSAIKDGGACLNDKKLSLQASPVISSTYMALGGEELAPFIKKLHGEEVRVFDLFSFAYCGSLVCSGGFIAAGMTYGSPWDAAAISLIAEESGGRATDLNGKIRDYSKWGDGILITNGAVHDELVRMIDYENIRN